MLKIIYILHNTFISFRGNLTPSSYFLKNILKIYLFFKKIFWFPVFLKISITEIF